MAAERFLPGVGDDLTELMDGLARHVVMCIDGRRRYSQRRRIVGQATVARLPTASATSPAGFDSS